MKKKHNNNALQQQKYTQNYKNKINMGVFICMYKIFLFLKIQRKSLFHKKNVRQISYEMKLKNMSLPYQVRELQFNA